MKEKVLSFLDEHKDEMFELLSDLLKIDTQNYISYGNEEAGQRFFAEYCKQKGFEAELYYPDDIPGFTEHAGYLAGRGTDKRPNVTAVFAGKGGGKKITLAAHMDTMPVGLEDDWSVPGLGGVMKDNRIYGRGSSDDKFGVAASLFAAMALRESGFTPEGDVYITSYCDEEMGGGNGALATCLKYPSDIYINLDGGGMQVLPYGVGGLSGMASLHTDETLSSCSRVFEGLKIMVDEFEKFGEERFRELGNHPVFAGTQNHKDAYRLLGTTCGDKGLDLNSAKMSFTYYTLKPQEEIEKEVKALADRISEKVSALGLIFDGIQPVSRFFHPICPDTVPEEAICFQNKLQETFKKPVSLAGGCLSDLSVIHKYGGGISFNTGLYKGFNEYGGPHQVDEYVDCDEFLAIAKALALYVLELNSKGE